MPSLKMHTTDIAVVKKTFRYSNVFFYNHVYQSYVLWNLFWKSGKIQRRGPVINAGIFFTETGTILVLTTYHFLAYPKLVEKFDEKGIAKFIAYEVLIEKVKEKYGKKLCLEQDSNGNRELRIIDSNQRQIFNNFSIIDLGEPVLYEKQGRHGYKCKVGKLSGLPS